MPAPKVTAAEAAHIAKLDAALAPARSYAPSILDAQRIRDAVKAIQSANVERFSLMRSEVENPVGKKLLDWAKLRAGYGTADDYRAFMQDNPLWPDKTLLVQRMEEAIFTQGGTAASIRSHFEGREPQTGVGIAALASAFLAENNETEAAKLARKAWRESPLPSSLESGFLKRFGSLLTFADHKWRFDRLLTDDVRWVANRADRAKAAQRVMALFPDNEKAKATARLAVFNKSGNAKTLMDALPSDASGDYGLIYHRIQLMRRAGQLDEAAKLILDQPADPDKIAELDEWWAERRGLAYLALKADKPKLAYQLVQNAGPLTVNPLKEQTFMAGWIAFRYLKDKTAASRHFADLAAAADGPLSRAKAAYWQGRVAEDNADANAASAYYKAATRDADTLHGLLAMQKLEPGRRRLSIAMPAEPSAADIEKFNASDIVKAAVLARKAGLQREYQRAFLTAIRLAYDSEAGAGMTAHLAESLGDTQMAVRLAKSSVAKGYNVIIYGYPVHPFPPYRALRTPPETAFLLGIARQETEFNADTVSGAGAKGILQVMTITANHVCRDYKIKCEIGRLLTDTSYNAKIASAYIADRMDEFGGSYVLGLAGYNAGPGRARQWIKEFGDPRDPKIDPIDWMERIPIQETRDYVMKVLANIQVYRARLGGEGNALRIDQDLERARGSVKEPAATTDDEPGNTTASDG